MRWSLLGGLLLAACLIAVILASAQASEESAQTAAEALDPSEIRLHAFEAPLPQVIEVMAASLGLESRISPSVVERADAVTERLTGKGEQSLLAVAQRFGLSVYVDDGVAWIDGIDERHTNTITVSDDLAERLLDALASDPAVAESSLTLNGDELNITGNRQQLAYTSRLAAELIQQFKIDESRESAARERRAALEKKALLEREAAREREAALANETARAKEVVSAEATRADESEQDRNAPTALAAPSTETPLSERATSPAPVPTEKPEAMRSISDVPGFDTDYKQW